MNPLRKGIGDNPIKVKLASGEYRFEPIGRGRWKEYWTPENGSEKYEGTVSTSEVQDTINLADSK